MVEEELGEQQRVHTWRSDSLTVYTPPPRYVYLFLLLCLMRLPFYRFQGSSSLEETPDPSIHWSSTPTEVEVEVVTPASFSSSLTYESVQPGTPAPNQLAVRSCTVTPPIYSPQATQWSGGFPTPIGGSLAADSLPGSPNVFLDVWSGIPSSSGPVRVTRRKRGEIVPYENEEEVVDAHIDAFRVLDLTKRDFRFCSKNYFLTWSQIGDTPNSALEDKMASFGNLIKGMLS
jgi:hypothetical protein